MSYQHRHRYKTMREKNANVKKKVKMTILFIILAGLGAIFFNRVYIMDYIRTSMY